MHALSGDGTQARFEVDADALDAALRQLTHFGVRALTSSPPTLEELFMRHYGDPAPVVANVGAR